jgi:type II secretory pathway pseudopilin PulG
MSFPFRTSRSSPAFSLIEVVMAIGIVAFALVALMGLLPAGLSAQRQALSRARCVQALSELSDAARGIYVSTNGSTNFPKPLDGITTGTAGETSYALLGNGVFTNSGDDIRGRVYIKQYAPVNDVIPLYISVAWPASAARSNATWKAAQGSVESLVFVDLP